MSFVSAGVNPRLDHGSKLPGERGHLSHQPNTRTDAPGHPSITHRLLAKRIFPGTRRRFLLRLARVSPQLQKIRTVWRGLLAELELTPDAERALHSLDVERLYGYLQSGDLHSYEFALTHLGQDLADRKVPEEYSVAALGLFFEICLCGLLGEPRRDTEFVLGLTRLASVSQLFLASGYAHRRAAGMRVVQEKLKSTEKRAAALAISVSDANEKERRRLASDLHDEIGHDLVVLKLYLEMITGDIKDKIDDDSRKKLSEVIGLATRAIDSVRQLAFDLGPGIFEESGFIPAIRSYARHFSANTGVKVSVRVALSGGQLQPRDELTLYRVLQGALSNVLKHSGAKTVSITVKSDANSVSMTVEDNGKGFNVARKLRDSRGSFGLQTMRERIELLGGSFQIHSPVQSGKKRSGTKIEVCLPLIHGRQNEQKVQSSHM